MDQNIVDDCVSVKDFDFIFVIHGSVEVVYLNRGKLPSQREKNNGIGIYLNDLISNLNFSTKKLTVISAEIVNIDLSAVTRLEYLDLSSNPINQINLSWVPKLQFLNLQNTGLKKLDVVEMNYLNKLLI